MPEPVFGLKSSLSQHSFFLRRVLENLKSVWKMPRVSLRSPLSASGAPIHLLEDGPNADFAAQLSSTGVHVLLIVGLILVLTHPRVTQEPPNGRESGVFKRLIYPAPMPTHADATGSLGTSGNSGGHDVLPPTAGEPAPLSRIVLAPPRLPDGRQHVLEVQSAVFDADAPELTPPVKNPGLPWMKDKNGSNGPGKNGIGDGPGHGMGTGPGDGEGVGNEPGIYGIVAAPVACKICPDPLYSDEARKAKLQGHITLRVLVGADGRAKEIQVVHGLGMGLDENAIGAVRGWQFVAAKDATRRPVASWITIETVFRLF